MLTHIKIILISCNRGFYDDLGSKHYTTLSNPFVIAIICSNHTYEYKDFEINNSHLEVLSFLN